MALKKNQDQAFLILMTIEHALIGTPRRIVRNRKSIVSRGNTYNPYGFSLVMPTDSEAASQCKITVGNISRSLTRAIEVLPSSPTTTIEIVLSSALNDPLMTFTGFEYSDITWDAFVVTGNLSKTKFWDEPYPKEAITPYSFPGLFAQ